MKYIGLIFSVATVVVSMAGCITTESIQYKVDAKPSCCKSMGEFKYETLELGRNLVFQLNDDYPVFAFETYKSYFRLFLLPSVTKMLRVWSPAFISQFEIPRKGRYVILHTKPKIYDQMAVRYTNGGGYMVGSAFVF